VQCSGNYMRVQAFGFGCGNGGGSDTKDKQGAKIVLSPPSEDCTVSCHSIEKENAGSMNRKEVILGGGDSDEAHHSAGSQRGTLSEVA